MFQLLSIRPKPNISTLLHFVLLDLDKNCWFAEFVYFVVEASHVSLGSDDLDITILSVLKDLLKLNLELLLLETLVQLLTCSREYLVVVFVIL